MRFRLEPTSEQEAALAQHCEHARYVWNLAVEQQNCWRPGRASQPNSSARMRQLAEARQANDWLRAGSSVVQQQALNDYDTALKAFFAQPAKGKPDFRSFKRGDNGFRIVNCKPEHVRHLSRNVGEVMVPKVGWVRFRWSRQVSEFKSFRITFDRSGRWHVAFAIIPKPYNGPQDGSVVGVDRGVVVSAALSTGDLLCVEGLSDGEACRLLLLQRKLSRCKRGSNRRQRIKRQIAALKARETDRRKDWVEKTSTRLATEFDTIGIEDLKVKQMSKSGKHKRGLNRGILANGWTMLANRLDQKAPGRVVRVPAPYTSRRCSACGFVVDGSRESQAVFACKGCGYAEHADVNAARNIATAAGRAVAARAVSKGDIALLAREPLLVS